MLTLKALKFFGLIGPKKCAEILIYNLNRVPRLPKSLEKFLVFYMFFIRKKLVFWGKMAN